MHTIYRKLIGLTIKGGQKGRGLLFFFGIFFRIFEIFFASAEHSFFNGFLRIKYVMSIFFSV